MANNIKYRGDKTQISYIVKTLNPSPRPLCGRGFRHIFVVSAEV